MAAISQRVGTGDLVLFDSKSINSYAVSLVTASR